MLELETITTTTKEQPRMANKLTATFSKVKVLLETDMKYRDSDEMLETKFWWTEMQVMGIDGKAITARDFFLMYRQGKFTSSSTILRARRKANQLLSETRGLSYKPRRNKQVEIKEELKKLDTVHGQ